jgi:hypothetical protein|tara:strand:- start:110 stop:385 length:276 start_codon:yes stop_codon:yes gene_type:complete
MIKVLYKAISKRQPYKDDWRTLKEFFEDIGGTGTNGKWSIENGLVYFERDYETNNKWEEAITSYHKRADPIRPCRFEIVKETNGDKDGIPS